jgi:tetratricopeptide (TPR) repeat protein
MVRAAVEKTNLREPSAAAALRGMLRDTMRRHPAEPYFPFIGALVAFRSGVDSPIPWLQRSLERALVNGKAHLLLAEVLADKGAVRQALFELRLAVETDFALTDYAARLAVRWAKDYDEALLAVPDGSKGAVMLDTLGVVAAGTPLGARCDREAIARDPAIVGPHEREANALIAALKDTYQKNPSNGGASTKGTGLCANRVLCQEEIEAHAARVASALPRASTAAQIRARALVADGRAADAELLLAAACPTVKDRESCLLARLSAALSAGRSDRVDVATKELLGASCATAAACADMATRIADMRAGQGELGAALVLYARAAREDPVESRWLRLADAASRSGAHAQAAAALEKIAQKRAGGDAALRKRIEEERARALGDLLPR